MLQVDSKYHKIKNRQKENKMGRNVDNPKLNSFAKATNSKCEPPKKKTIIKPEVLAGIKLVRHHVRVRRSERFLTPRKLKRKIQTTTTIHRPI